MCTTLTVSNSDTTASEAGQYSGHRQRRNGRAVQYAEFNTVCCAVRCTGDDTASKHQIILANGHHMPIQPSIEVGPQSPTSPLLAVRAFSAFQTSAAEIYVVDGKSGTCSLMHPVCTTLCSKTAAAQPKKEAAQQTCWCIIHAPGLHHHVTVCPNPLTPHPKCRLVTSECFCHTATKDANPDDSS